MRESGEPMEFGIFNYSKVFSRAFGEDDNGVGGTSNGSRWGHIPWNKVPRPVNNTLHPDFSFRPSMSQIHFISTQID